jgi:hypothetical protein
MNIARQLAGALGRRHQRQCGPCVQIQTEPADERLVLAARSFLRRVGS